MLILGAVSFKKEIWIVLLTLSLIISLPIIAIMAVTDTNALKDPAITLYSGPVSTTNTYDFGYCTFWAALRREQAGEPIPNNWGNANTWANNARGQGFAVDMIPSVGAVMQTSAGPLGHVAYVEEVNPKEGSWTISEMNFKAWDQMDHRTLTLAAAAHYNFIH